MFNKDQVRTFWIFIMLLILFVLLDHVLDLGIFGNSNPDEPVYFE